MAESKVLANLLDILKHPTRDLQLQLDNHAGLSASESRDQFPVLRGVPFLMPVPELNYQEWVSRFSALFANSKRELDLLSVHLQNASVLALSSTTLLRLQQRFEAQKQNLAFYWQIFQDFSKDASLSSEVSAGTAQKLPGQELYEAFHLILSPRQNLLSYGDNLFRDWSWGEAEIAHSVRTTQELVNIGPEAKVLFLGAGAGRYCLELHKALAPKFSVISDINPLFLMTLNRLLEGERLQVWELPFAPRHPEHHAVLQTLDSEHRFDNRILLAFADSRALPFQNESFDLVVCPWLIDIQGEPVPQFLARMNQVLPIGGQLLVQGTLAFHFQDPSWNLTQPECVERAADSGFRLQKSKVVEEDYLKSPVAAGYRREQVTYMLFEKTASCATSTAVDHPAWLDNMDLAVPNTPGFMNFVHQHRVLADTVAQVNGRVSVKSMGRYLARRFKMSEPDAIDSLRRLLLKLNEETTYKVR